MLLRLWLQSYILVPRNSRANREPISSQLRSLLTRRPRLGRNSSRQLIWVPSSTRSIMVFQWEKLHSSCSRPSMTNCKLKLISTELLSRLSTQDLLTVLKSVLCSTWTFWTSYLKDQALSSSPSWTQLSRHSRSSSVAILSWLLRSRVKKEPRIFSELFSEWSTLLTNPQSSRISHHQGSMTSSAIQWWQMLTPRVSTRRSPLPTESMPSSEQRTYLQKEQKAYPRLLQLQQN